MSQCQCRTLVGGDRVVCDFCASRMIEMLNDVVPGQHMSLPVLTEGEYTGMLSAVNLWMNGLQSQGYGEQEIRAW